MLQDSSFSIDHRRWSHASAKISAQPGPCAVYTFTPAYHLLPSLCTHSEGKRIRGHHWTTEGQALFNPKQNSPLSLFHTHSIICQVMSNNVKQNHKHFANNTRTPRRILKLTTAYGKSIIDVILKLHKSHVCLITVLITVNVWCD